MNRHKKYALYLLLAVYAVFCLISKLSIAINSPLDSDNAQPAVVFYDIVKNHNYLLKNWYVITNNYLFTDFPLYYVSGMIFGMTPLTVKMVAFCVFVLGVCLFSLVLNKTCGKEVAATSAVAILSISFFSAQILLKPAFHAATIAVSFLALLLVILISERDRADMQNKIVYLILFIVSAVTVFSDPFYIFIFAAPLVSSLAIWRITGKRLLSGRGDLILSIVVLGSVVAGLLLQDAASLWGLHVTTFQTLLSLDSLTKHTALIHSVNRLFDMDFWKEPFSLKALAGVANLTLVLLVAASCYLILRKEKNGFKKFAMVYFVMVVLLTTLSFVAKERFSDYAAPRHLMPLLYAFSAFFGLSAGGPYFGMRFKAVLIVLLLVSGANSAREGFGYRPEQPKTELVQFLEKENLTRGYSSYFNSHIITLLSNNRVKVRPLFCYNDMCRPFLWVSKSDWYRPTLHDGPTFLMIPKTETISGGANFEILYAMPDLVIEKFGKPRRILKFNDMLIYEWPYNIMEKLISVNISANTPRTTGRFEHTPAGEKVLYSQKGQEGALVYGNYWPLMKGEYMAVFKLWVQGDAGQEVAVIDVSEVDIETQRYTSRRFTKRIIAGDKPEWQKYPIEFKALGNGGLQYECRVFVTGAGEVRVKSIIMEQLYAGADLPTAKRKLTEAIREIF